MWIWRDGAFVPIVDASIFEQARRIIESRHQHLTDQDLLERLRELLRKHGRLSGLLIDETETMPSSSCYSTRLSSLVRAAVEGGRLPRMAVRKAKRHLESCWNSRSAATELELLAQTAYALLSRGDESDRAQRDTAKAEFLRRKAKVDKNWDKKLSRSPLMPFQQAASSVG